MKTSEAIDKAQEIARDWARCVPGDDPLEAAELERQKHGYVILAQALIDDADRPDFVFDYFTAIGMPVKRPTPPKMPWPTARKQYTAIMIVISAIILILLHFSGSHEWINPEAVLVFGLAGLGFATFLYLNGEFFGSSSGHCH